MPSEILRVSIFISYLRKFYGARNLLFSKVTKKFSWTYTLEFWAEIFSQYSPLKVEEHNVPSEFRSDAWFMRKKIVSILKKPHCNTTITGLCNHKGCHTNNSITYAVVTNDCMHQGIGYYTSVAVSFYIYENPGLRILKSGLFIFTKIR